MYKDFLKLFNPKPRTNDRTSEIQALNEKLAMANEELKITNEELSAYQQQLEQLVRIRTHELMRKEESLRYKNQLEKLISEISSRFFSLPPESVDDNLRSSIEEISAFVHADAAFLAEILYNENIFVIQHACTTRKVHFEAKNLQSRPLSELTWWLQKEPERDFSVINDIISLPVQNEFGHILCNSGIYSLIFVPIRYQKHLVGFMGFGSNEVNQIWTSDEISLIQVVGEIYLNALKRKVFEKILIESERNYREIFNASNEAIFIYDPVNDSILDVNQAALQLFQITYKETLKSTLEHFSKEHADIPLNKAKGYIHTAVEKGSVLFETHLKREKDEFLSLEVSLKKVEIAGDLRILAVIRDISERKRAQELIMQSEERFRSIVQYLTDIIWIVDADLKVLYESPSSSHILGYAPGFLLGKTGYEIVHPDDLSTIHEEFEKVLHKQNDYIPTEIRIRHAKGNWLSLDIIANNMLDHSSIKGIVLVGRDITERNRVEKALRISEAKFRNIFNNSTDSIVIINQHHAFLETNEVFHSHTGYSNDDLKKMKINDIIPDAYLHHLAETLVKAFQHEHTPSLECEILCKDNTIFPAEINSKVMEYEGEEVLISVIRNISERKQVEARILDTIIATEERERDKFARNLHDELGPLLSSIKMYVNSLSSATDSSFRNDLKNKKKKDSPQVSGKDGNTMLSVEKSKDDFILTQLREILTEVIQSTKEISNDLSPQVLANYGLVAALDWFINHLKPHITIHFETNLKEERFPNLLEVSLYRIIKELINNTLKHAQASNITVKIHLILKALHVKYIDDGKGFPQNWQDNMASMGMGMSNIVSRSKLLNATCKFFNNSPLGMSFEMELPVEI
jgi:PAS domain S-box-containing protein